MDAPDRFGPTPYEDDPWIYVTGLNERIAYLRGRFGSGNGWTPRIVLASEIDDYALPGGTLGLVDHVVDYLLRYFLLGLPLREFRPAREGEPRGFFRYGPHWIAGPDARGGLGFSLPQVYDIAVALDLLAALPTPRWNYWFQFEGSSRIIRNAEAARDHLTSRTTLIVRGTPSGVDGLYVPGFPTAGEVWDSAWIQMLTEAGLQSGPAQTGLLQTGSWGGGIRLDSEIWPAANEPGARATYLVDPVTGRDIVDLPGLWHPDSPLPPKRFRGALVGRHRPDLAREARTLFDIEDLQAPAQTWVGGPISMDARFLRLLDTLAHEFNHAALHGFGGGEAEQCDLPVNPWGFALAWGDEREMDGIHPHGWVRVVGSELAEAALFGVPRGWSASRWCCASVAPSWCGRP